MRDPQREPYPEAFETESLRADEVDTGTYASRGKLLQTEDYRTKHQTRGGPTPSYSGVQAQFEDLTNIDLYGWNVDSSDAFYGTQCLASASGESGPEAYHTLSQASIDITGLQPSLAVKHAGDGAATIAIKCRDTSGNYHQFRRAINPDKHATGWHVVDIGPSGLYGAFDPTAVDLVRLTVGGITSAPFKVDSFKWTEQPPKGAVVFIFDDGNGTVYDNALPEFEQRGLAATVGVISSLVDEESSAMTTPQLTELHDKGWAMMNHQKTNSDVYDVSSNTVHEEFRDCKEFLVRNNFYNGPDTVVYRGGGYDVQTMDISADYHQLGFTTGSGSTGVTAYNNRNPLNLTRPFMSGASTSTLQNIIDRTMAFGSLAAISFHTVSSSGDITQADLATILDYCIDSGARVLTVDEYAADHRTVV